MLHGLARMISMISMAAVKQRHGGCAPNDSDETQQDHQDAAYEVEPCSPHRLGEVAGQAQDEQGGNG